MGALLLLLLAFNNWLNWGGTAKVSESTEEWVLAESGESTVDVESSSMLTKDRVGVLDVGGGEGLDGILKGRETGDNLWRILASRF